MLTKQLGDEPDRRHIKSAVLATKSTSDRRTADDLWDLAQNPGTTHHAPFTSLIATNTKNANGAGGYEGRVLSRWDGAPVHQAAPTAS